MKSKHLYLYLYEDSPRTDPKLAFAIWHGADLLKTFKYTQKFYFTTKTCYNAFSYKTISAQDDYMLVQYMQNVVKYKRVEQREIYKIANEAWTPTTCSQRQRRPQTRSLLPITLR